MESNPVRWFEIYVQDMGRAKSFYESVFQLRLQKLEQVWLIASSGALERLLLK